MNVQGTIIAAHGRHYKVELTDGRVVPCFPRGKKSELACGDQVDIQLSGDSQGVVETILARQSLLYRSNEFRQKLIAANVTQVVIVVATEPSFSEELVTRCLVAAESQQLKVLIVLNKCDLAERVDAAAERLAGLVRLGYPLLRLSARQGAAALRPLLEGHDSVLVGQSGMGKSTLINALVPDANARTLAISHALDSGRHTTTHAARYRIADTGTLIDSPGLQEFGLHHLTTSELEHAFPEFRPFLGQCRFRDCRHDREPGCALRQAVDVGSIPTGRFSAYRQLRREAAAA